MITLGLILGIGVGELAARAIGFEYRPHMRNRVYFAEPDRDRGWRNRAGIAGPYGGDEFLTWVTINEAGQRGPNHPMHRTPGKTRVAILGDSQAWGDGVGDDETFAARLDDAETEVLNFAVIGYGTDQQLLTLEQVVAPYRPDVVVITAYMGNDLHDNVYAGTWQFPKPWFQLTHDGSLQVQGVPVEASALLQVGIEIYRGAMRHSAILNALAETTVDKNQPKPGGRERWHLGGRPMRSVYTADVTEADAAALRITARLLVEVGRRARAMGAEPIVLILPDPWQVEASNDPEWRAELRENGIDWRRPQKVLRRALEAEDIPTIDATQLLGRESRGHTGRERTYYPRWKHLTVVGHQAIADALRPRLALGSATGEAGQDR
ncbi:MAG: SGNH/GDSL hydrolase family protein [Candidatus Binatia bacterium]|nr:SGNH/GDSL hydrolase family protein [Candidatus Binatia bacterium]